MHRCSVQGAMWPEEAGVPHATATLYMLVLISVPCGLPGTTGVPLSVSPEAPRPELVRRQIWVSSLGHPPVGDQTHDLREREFKEQPFSLVQEVQPLPVHSQDQRSLRQLGAWPEEMV